MKKLWHEHKEKFFSALFDALGKASAGIIIILALSKIVPSIDGNRIANLAETYIKTQGEMGKQMLEEIKEQHHHDTLTVKKSEVIKPSSKK
ncbi:MAG: hypothetical protein HY841_15250 [Bacteroidetes bacterium]|nr:hypothetical protein [Bacteroidota bacterium]